MTDRIKAGDKVRYISVASSSSRLKHGQIYNVRKVSPSAADPGEDSVFLEDFPSSGVWWYARRFEIVRDRVSLTIEGNVMARAVGSVSLKLDDGTTVILPESLVPEDPNLTAFRNLMRAVCMNANLPATGDYFGEGKYDDSLRALLPQFMEGRGRSA